MITKEIIVKAPASSYRPTGWPYPQQRPIVPIERRMDKLEYIDYISNKLGLREGDIVYSYSATQDNGKEVKDLLPHRFFFVQGIQELHYSVEYTANNEPRCLFLLNFNTLNSGNCGFWTSNSTYKRADYNDLSEECQKIVDAYHHRKASN